MLFHLNVRIFQIKVNIPKMTEKLFGKC
uniref:Uncharacterized protein n=1 Tax=Anguilla anguilla TaxID=7936 RepID=A0A0E9Q3C9_ANGAN